MLFHKMVRKKRFKDQIKLLVDPEGRRPIAYEDIASEAIKFYMDLLGTPDISCQEGSVEEINALLNYHPTLADSDMLIK